MKRWFKGGLAFAGMVGGFASAAALGAWRWNRSTTRTVARLERERIRVAPELVHVDALDAVPAPVMRYFAMALGPHQQRVKRARIEHAGEFRTGGIRGTWKPFTDVQHFTVDPPGFVWDAVIRTAPLVTIRVRDTYVAGIGGMQGKLGSLVTVIDRHGTPELAAGALHRYLAEAVWFPTALLPSQTLSWEAVDDHSARATLTDGATLSVSLTFEFGEDGRIVTAYTPSRYRDVGGVPVPTPWFCHYRDYTRIEGMSVPMRGEVEWLLPDGELPYWRGVIVRAVYGY